MTPNHALKGDAVKHRASLSHRARRALAPLDGIVGTTEQLSMQTEQPKPFEQTLGEELRKLNLATNWTNSALPSASLSIEFTELMRPDTRRAAISTYIRECPSISSSVALVYFQLAMAAGVHWNQASTVLQPFAKKGWHLGRWSPTFLVVDGPVGRFFRHGNSPVSNALKVGSTSFPLLSEARNAFADKSGPLWQIRHGFAH